MIFQADTTGIAQTIAAATDAQLADLGRVFHNLSTAAVKAGDRVQVKRARIRRSMVEAEIDRRGVQA